MDEVVEYAERVLGRCAVVGDFSWEHRMSRVLRLRDEHGVAWFVKQHRDRDRYDAEVTAYREWVPALGDRAPRLHSYDHGLRAIVISVVPGTPAPWPPPEAPAADRQRGPEAAIHRQAGAILRRLHGARAPLPRPDIGAAKTHELDGLIAEAGPGLLADTELGFVRAQVHALNAIGSATMVPCHRDYTPRNWLVHDGLVSVIDFEWARLDAPAGDLARMHLAIWAGRPDLEEAFFDGYGRGLDAQDRIVLDSYAALTAIWLIIKARETAQPTFEQAIRSALANLMDRAATR